jgi:hypothetical protein
MLEFDHKIKKMTFYFEKRPICSLPLVMCNYHDRFHFSLSLSLSLCIQGGVHATPEVAMFTYFLWRFFNPLGGDG